MNRDEVFRPLELTAPGHTLAAVEREDSEVSEEEKTPAEPTSRHDRWRWPVLAAVALLALVLGYGLGAWRHSRPGTKSGSSAKARPMATTAPRWPVVKTPGLTPKLLRGCRATFRSVTVDDTGRVTGLDERDVEVSCPSTPLGVDVTVLESNAVSALRNWRFTPARFRGKPVTTTTPIELTFEK